MLRAFGSCSKHSVLEERRGRAGLAEKLCRTGVRFRRARAPAAHYQELNIQILHIQRVLFNELPARFDVFAHEGGEDGSHSARSSSFTERRVRRSGSMVVSQSCGAVIS